MSEEKSKAKSKKRSRVAVRDMIMTTETSFGFGESELSPLGLSLKLTRRNLGGGNSKGKMFFTTLIEQIFARSSKKGGRWKNESTQFSAELPQMTMIQWTPLNPATSACYQGGWSC